MIIIIIRGITLKTKNTTTKVCWGCKKKWMLTTKIIKIKSKHKDNDVDDNHDNKP